MDSVDRELTDYEKRGLILEELYDRRRERPVSLTSDDFDGELSEREIDRIAHQLFEHDLIWAAFALTNPAARIGKLQKAAIIAHGIDVVEGTKQAPISIRIDRRSYFEGASFQGPANIQTGANSRQEIQYIFSQAAEIVEQSDADPKLKKTILSVLRSGAGSIMPQLLALGLFP